VYGTAVGVTTGIYAPKKIYILGAAGIPSRMVTWVYDYVKDTWSTAMAMPTYRHFFGVAVVDDVLYAIGGATSFRTTREGYFSITEQYVPLGYAGTLPPVTSVMVPPASSESSGAVPPTSTSAPLESSDLFSKSDSHFVGMDTGLFILIVTFGLTTIMAILIVIGLTLRKRRQ
jgi:hypothetical protein